MKKIGFIGAYDKTDLIFYVIIVPLGIYALIKLYSIYKSKKSA